MDTKWLEDFVSLAQTRSFSRRIRALEAWAGVDLVDRSIYPTRLTPAGETFLAQASEMLASMQATRNLLLAHQASGSDMVDFALPHTLAFAFFAQWLLELRRAFPELKTRLIALNVHDAVLRLTEGHCDLLLASFARADGEGRPVWRLPGSASCKLPFLSYAVGVYMARLVEHILKGAPQPPQLDLVYETDMAESLKAMALEGHGLAFLPASSVKKDLRAGRLAAAGEVGAWELTMDVRIVRERPQSARMVKPGAAALWEHLLQAAG